MDIQDVARRFVVLSVLHRAHIRKKACSGELHDGQLPLLEAIVFMPGSTQQELAEKLFVSPASVALSAKRLEKSGLIRRTADDSDRRRNLLYATEAGVALAVRHRTIINEADEEMLRGFTEAERDALADYLDRMLVNIRQYSGLGICRTENEGEPKTHV